MFIRRAATFRRAGERGARRYRARSVNRIVAGQLASWEAEEAKADGEIASPVVTGCDHRRGKTPQRAFELSCATCFSGWPCSPAKTPRLLEYGAERLHSNLPKVVLWQRLLQFFPRGSVGRTARPTSIWPILRPRRIAAARMRPNFSKKILGECCGPLLY